MSKLEKMEVTPEERGAPRSSSELQQVIPRWLSAIAMVRTRAVRQPYQAARLNNNSPSLRGGVIDKEHKDNPKTKMRWRQ